MHAANQRLLSRKVLMSVKQTTLGSKKKVNPASGSSMQFLLGSHQRAATPRQRSEQRERLFFNVSLYDKMLDIYSLIHVLINLR